MIAFVCRAMKWRRHVSPAKQHMGVGRDPALVAVGTGTAPGTAPGTVLGMVFDTVSFEMRWSFLVVAQ